MTLKQREARQQANARRRLTLRRKLESCPTCPICGGRIVDARCRGTEFVRCGLHYTQEAP